MDRAGAAAPKCNQIREEDTDWRKWLLNKPYRPFDPRAYFEFRLYSEFSSGIPDQWMSHGIDMVHYLTGRSVPAFRGGPRRRLSRGGTAAKIQTPSRRCWNIRKDFWSAIRPASATIPTASRASWATKATLVNIGGEGSQRWKLVEEKGTHEHNPFVRRAAEVHQAQATERHGMSWSQKLLIGRRREDLRTAPVHFRLQSFATCGTGWSVCARATSPTLPWIRDWPNRWR